ncbi:zinc finger protein 79-like [Achroia grisella]|uniref:zinc finger protein 79-like n=1 Tax=Achroia grisella TaxID=688607 RepID=UPI0027D2B501|nr:zinc finger protein 79-like [Achroia grisella]
MEDVKVCRLCLITDVKMYDVESYPFVNYFESIIGNNAFNALGMPLYSCYECTALAKKYHDFKERCIRGQAVLYDLLCKSGKITKTGITCVNRHDLHLQSNLSTTKSFVVDVLIDYQCPEISPEKSQQEIKQEPSIEDIEQPSAVETEDVKLEDSFDVFLSPTVSSSEDDEPLSRHRSKDKDKKKGKKKKKIVGDNCSTNNDTNEASEPEVLPVVPRKRGRPKKTETVPKPRKGRRAPTVEGIPCDEDDLEQYVTVIKLTEQEQIEEIMKRQESSNYLNAPYRCDLCYKGFIEPRAWKHHRSKHDPSAGDIECVVCKFRFKTKRTLQKHAANHEKKYACKSCPYISKTTTQAKQHQRWHKGVTYKCQYCDEVSTKWTSYLSHVRIKHPSEFICGVCGYSFVSKLGLAMHKTMMHKEQAQKEQEEGENEEDMQYCKDCDVKFISLEAFKRHMVTSAKHAQSTNFNTGCRACGETFECAESLRLHHRRQHARQRPKNYGKKPAALRWPTRCEHCSEEIPNAREYWTHFRRAHPDKKYPIQKNYICDICGKGFRGNAFLVYHKRTHFEERAYKCAQCPKAFHNRTNLQMHEKTHSDHRPYPCTVCMKAFKSKGALDRHFRSHTGVKPYPCEVCGKAFGQSNSRKLHVRTVHLRQPAPYLSRTRLERLERRARPPRPDACY